MIPRQKKSLEKNVNAVVLSWLMNFVSTNLLSGIVYASSACVVWKELKERFDKINGSITFSLHKKIATMSQGTNSVSVYFTKLKELWDEFESLIPSPECGCEKSRDIVSISNGAQ